MTGLNIARALTGASTKYHNPLLGGNRSIDDFNTIFANLDAAMSNIEETTIGVTITAGEAVMAGDAGYVRQSDGKAYLLDADDAMPDMGVVRGFFPSDAGVDEVTVLQVRGILDGFLGLTVGALVYADTTAGFITQTRPTPTLDGSQVVVAILGIAISATQIYVLPQNVLYLKRAEVIQDETIEIVHAPDANGYVRDVWAYMSSSDLGVVVTEKTIGTESFTAALKNNASDSDALAQSFTLASETDLGIVQWYLRKTGSPTGTLTMRIETIVSDEPSGTLAVAGAEATFAESELSTSYAMANFDFTGITLSAGTYALVLTTDRADDAVNFVESPIQNYPGMTPDAYPDGRFWSYEGVSWRGIGNDDATFTVRGVGVEQVTRLSVGWWDSTHADVVNRYGDTSNANLETITTFKCVAAAGFDDVTVVVEMP